MVRSFAYGILTGSSAWPRDASAPIRHEHHEANSASDAARRRQRGPASIAAIDVACGRGAFATAPSATRGARKPLRRRNSQVAALSSDAFFASPDSPVPQARASVRCPRQVARSYGRESPLDGGLHDASGRLPPAGLGPSVVP